MTDVIYVDNAATTYAKLRVMHDAVRNIYGNCDVSIGRIGGGRRRRHKGSRKGYVTT